MRKSRVTLGVLAAGVLAAALVVPGVALAGSSTCPIGKQCFAVTSVSATTPPTGASTPFTFAIANESSSSALNSVTITAPANMQITGVTLPSSESSASITPGSGAFPATSVTIGTHAAEQSFETSPTTAGALGLKPGASTQVIVTATAPCADGPSTSYNWVITGTSDGDNDSDDLQLDPASQPNLAGTVTGSCYLEFARNAGPADTIVNDPITSEAGSQGGPVEVDVMSAANTLVADPTAQAAQVELQIASSTASSPSLSGTTTATAINGVASFPSINQTPMSINETGTYTLGATATGAGILGYLSPGAPPGVTSANFDIFPSGTTCTSTSCDASVTGTNANSSVSTSSAAAGDFLEIGAGGPSYTCTNYTATSQPVSFDLYSSSGVAQDGTEFTAVLQIDKAAVQASGHLGASSWQICYASTDSFPGATPNVNIGGTDYYVGLLPDCTSADIAPCVTSEHKDGAGNEVITFLVKADSGDPKWQA